MAATDLTELDALFSFTVPAPAPPTAAEEAALDAEDARLWWDLQGIPAAD